MDALRIRAAAKKRLKSRADILGLVRNGNIKRTIIRKKQPKIKPRYGIFRNAISFKVTPRNRKSLNERTKNVWTVSNNNKVTPKIADQIETAKAEEKENIPLKSASSDLSRKLDFSVGNDSFKNSPITEDIIPSFLATETTTQSNKIQGRFEASLRNCILKSRLANHSQQSSPFQNEPKRIRQDLPAFTFEMACEQNRLAAREALELFFPSTSSHKRLQQSNDSVNDLASQMTYQSVVCSALHARY